MTPPTSSASPTVPTQLSVLALAQSSAPAKNSAPATGAKGTTYIPLPIPAFPAERPSGAAAVFLVVLLLILAALLRFLWRLPERLRYHSWVVALGGPAKIQTRALHMLGYVSFVAGLLLNNFTNGVIAAGILMIAANTRATDDV